MCVPCPSLTASTASAPSTYPPSALSANAYKCDVLATLVGHAAPISVLLLYYMLIFCFFYFIFLLITDDSLTIIYNFHHHHYYYFPACIFSEPATALCASGDTDGVVCVWDMRRCALFQRLVIGDAVILAGLPKIDSDLSDLLDEAEKFVVSPSLLPKHNYPVTALVIYPSDGDIIACSGTIFVRWNVNGELLCCDRFCYRDDAMMMM
jgi:WD40 repeat protein